MSCGEAGVSTELVTSSFQFKGYAVGPRPYASGGTLPYIFGVHLGNGCSYARRFEVPECGNQDRDRQRTVATKERQPSCGPLRRRDRVPLSMRARLLRARRKRPRCRAAEQR
jgi:hypothetical protein